MNFLTAFCPGLEKEFEVALRKLRGKDADVSQEAAEIQACVYALQSLPKARILDLFDSKYIRSVIIGIGLMVSQQFIGINGISFYASQTFESAGLSNSNIGTIAYATVQVPITVVGAFLMDRSGRRPLLMVSATGTFVGCFLTGASFYLKIPNPILSENAKGSRAKTWSIVSSFWSRSMPTSGMR